ncbi:hypothetical protein ES319_A13G065700v1 [Gossypium barbadense]|nr:hypothetical protein ES319_A13G065700v1 [Gossypium barbadense]KAB2047700.1 hypothetical protein ES319_A13G065700v1 [Gossypium barbadense]TYG85590.1 hypothetical protein ES288_A13G067500v1 [Gossypium darwinii]
MNLSTLFQDKFGYSWRVARVEAVVEMACGSRKLGLPMLKIYLFFGPFKPKFLIILSLYLSKFNL